MTNQDRKDVHPAPEKTKLNEQQQQVVDHEYGPCFVCACPGSGKTKCIVERVVNLVKKGHEARSILCITFTNKASAEMKERICHQLPEVGHEVYISTFHSLCLTILRKLGKSIGYDLNTTILNEEDQEGLISQCARQLGFEYSAVQIRDLIKKCNDLRENLISEDEFGNHFKVQEDASICLDYISRMRKNNQLDFSGILSETLRLFNSDKEVLGKLIQRFSFLQIDETQDTNLAQFKIAEAIGAHGNILIVGDPDQCIPEGEKILTSQGYKNIEDITMEDIVISAFGFGKTGESRITKIHKRFTSEDIAEIETSSGKIIKTTFNHVHFAEFDQIEKEKYIVYLMYKSTLGYRVGITKSYRKENKKNVILGFQGRLRQERADSIWILDIVEEKSQAKLLEQFYSIKFGLPTWIFFTKNRGLSLDYRDEEIKKLFSLHDTSSSAKNILKYKNLDIDYPHYRPQTSSINDRLNLTITLCGDVSRNIKSYGAHRYCISGSDLSHSDLVESAGMNCRPAKDRRGWRAESSWKDFSKVNQIVNDIQKVLPDVNIIYKAKFSENKSLRFFTAKNLLPGMKIFTYKDGKIIEDNIISISRKTYTGYVYDLDIEGVHNYIVNDLVVHNCIYSWRGARYENIQDFIANNKAKVINLPQNYRSTPEIVKVASNLIKNNLNRQQTIDFKTSNASGKPVECYCLPNPDKEGLWIADKIRKLVNEEGYRYEDVAVLYRANAMSRAIEQGLMANAITYKIIGGFSFFDRSEVRDCLAMLRFFINPKDGTALCRFINKPSRRIGDVSLGKIENFANANNVDLIEAMKRVEEYLGSGKDKLKIISSCKEIVEAFNFDATGKSIGEILSILISKLDYNKYLESKFELKELEDKKENVQELINSCVIFASKKGNSISDYLANVTLQSSSDKESEENNVSLFSAHSSKGLEFPVVFVVGMEEGQMPHKRSFAEEKGMEEERRVCYVATTRAKKRLIISYAAYRMQKSRSGKPFYQPSSPSRFIKEMGLVPKKLG